MFSLFYKKNILKISQNICWFLVFELRFKNNLLVSDFRKRLQGCKELVNSVYVKKMFFT